MTSIRSTARDVIYARVSTGKQEREGTSLEDQVLRGRAYAVATTRGPVDDDDLYIDVDSGKSAERPAYQRLLVDAEVGRVRCVICTHIDRMGRDTLEFLQSDLALKKAGVDRIYIAQNFDTSTPYGQFAVTLFAAVAELEGKQIVERLAGGQRRKVGLRKEIWIVPYGYRYIPADPVHKIPGRVEIVPAQAAIVRRVFVAFAAGATAMGLARELTAEGVPTPKGRTMWGHSRIAVMVRAHAETYLGDASYGRTRTVRAGRRRTHVPVSDPSTVERAPIPAILDQPGDGDVVARARAQLASNRQRAKRNTRRDYLVRTFAVCGPCRDDGLTYRLHPMNHMYTCNRQDAATATFVRHRVGIKRLDAAVWDAIRALILDPSEVLNIARVGDDAGAVAAAALTREIAAREKALAELDQEIDTLLTALLKGRIDEARYDRRRATYEERRREATEALGRLAGDRALATARTLPVSEIEALCTRWAPGLDVMTFDERQAFTRLLVREVVVYKTHAIILGQFDDWSREVPLAAGMTGAPAAVGIVGEASPVALAPSGDDCRLDTDVLDHLVIGRQRFVSLKERGLGFGP